jgi:heat shock protein HslJ
MKFIIPVVFSLVLSANACSSQPGPDEHIYWVNSTKVPCVGVAPTNCLQVFKGEILDPSEWEFFHAPIEGFEFETGYVYKLLVREEKLAEEELPADASSIRFTLVKILQKEKDNRLVLNDIWVLEILNGKVIKAGANTELSERPRLEIHVGEMKYDGTDGCNNYFGGIIELGEARLRFGIGAGTRRMCPDMQVADEFNRTLPLVNSYQVKDLKLQLFDADGNEVMQFQKTD